jgi:hypothetical protein
MINKYKCIGLGLRYLTPLSTISHLFCGGQFYRWRKSEYQEKTNDLSQVTDKLKYKEQVQNNIQCIKINVYMYCYIWRYY